MISQALDSGNDLAGVVDRHIQHCSACKDFYRLSQSLNHKLVREASGFLRESNDTLNEKIISALALDTRSAPRLTKRRIRLPIPALAAALVVVAVTVGILLQTIPVNVDTSSKIENPLNTLTELDIANISLKDIIGRVESPIESEMFYLKQSITSASEFLISCLDVKIGETGE
jgi:predicted anti-sigma-YlaC factor YlaD